MNSTLNLKSSLLAWGSESFTEVFSKEVCAADADTLQLQKGLKQSSYASSDKLSVAILNTESNDKQLLIKAGLFYTGVIAGCNCADDPSPMDENNEYCEVLFCIDKDTAETTVTLTN